MARGVPHPPGLRPCDRSEAALRRSLGAALRAGIPMAWASPPDLPEAEVAALSPLIAGVSGIGAEAAARWRRWAAPDRPPPGELPAVTVIVPTHRGLAPGVLDALRAQVGVQLQVLILSNQGGPTRIPGARVLRVVWQGHGRTRQAALSEVHTPLVAFLSDDARPLGRGCVATLAAVLRDRPEVDAAVARQVPWPDGPAWVRHQVSSWTPWDGEGLFHQADHVFTLHRCARLARSPLPDVPIAEDLAWSAGRRIWLSTGAPVLHSHPADPRGRYLRARAEHAVRAARGLGRPLSAVELARGAVGALGVGLLGGPRSGLAVAAELAGRWSAGRGGGAG